MSLTIILSGPKFSESQARNALAAEAFDVQPPSPFAHGLPEMADGAAAVEPQSFITATGDDINRANKAVEALGWRLRMHYDTPVPAKPSAEQALADELASLRREVEELKASRAA